MSAETRDADLQTMAALLGMKTEDIQSKLSQSWVTDDVRVPVTTLDEKDTALEAQLLGIAGIYTDTTEVRTYPYGEKASQLTGYVQGISAEELEARGDEGYTESSVIGKTGLEAAFENRLRGKDGCKILVDQGGVDNYQMKRETGFRDRGYGPLPRTLPKRGRILRLPLTPRSRPDFMTRLHLIKAVLWP